MDLFQSVGQADLNILPQDGVANYHGPIFTRHDADIFLHRLLAEIPWRSDEVVMFGKRIVTKRQVAWFADGGLTYSYSKTTKSPLPFTPLLQEIRSGVEEASGETFNSCLLNLYASGAEGMSWHSDAERDLVTDGAIASVSFGAERKFSFKHKETKRTVSQMLEPGSLLVMKGQTQRYWLHSLPKTTKVTRPRINLTFRQVQSH